MKEVILTAENFEEEVLKSEIPVLVDFWAVWCGPCQMLAPILEEIAAENDTFKIGKVNCDEQMALAMQFRVVNIPTLLVFKNGQIVNRGVGYMEKEEVLSLVK